MTRKALSVLVLVGVLTSLLMGCAAQSPAMQVPTVAAPTSTPVPATEAPAVDEPDSGGPILEVVGPDGSQAFTVDDLKALPSTEGQAVIQSSTGSITPARVVQWRLPPRSGGLTGRIR